MEVEKYHDRDYCHLEAPESIYSLKLGMLRDIQTIGLQTRSFEFPEQWAALVEMIADGLVEVERIPIDVEYAGATRIQVNLVQWAD